MKQIILLLIFFVPSLYASDGILEDFDSLGGNDTLLQKVQALTPESRIKIVQQRIVDRFNRHEFSPEIGLISGGNSYFDTSFVALAYQYHINPHWSVGLKYNYYLNELTLEGDELINQAIENINEGNELTSIPEMNWPKQSYIAQLNWYPIYGKLNIYDKGVVHFDMYTILGVGQMDLRRGETMIYQIGFGTGFWISQHLTTRLEYKYKTYDVEYYAGTENTMVHDFSLSLGYML